MSEKEIINVINNLCFDEYEWWLNGYDEQTKEEDLKLVEQATLDLLDLYNKEKEKNKKLKEKNKKLKKENEASKIIYETYKEMIEEIENHIPYID